jgi:outer membrane protein assembly factor BamB/tetratricopeptide (TPR) repeat protein
MSIAAALSIVMVCGAPGTAQTNRSQAAADAYTAIYRAYDPGYRFIGGLSKEERDFSTESTFYTLNSVNASERADALMQAAENKVTQENRPMDAVEIYQKVIDEYAECLYRVNPYGVFVPIAQVCQRRLLALPPEALKFYRDKHDARAAQAFDVAWRRNSLEGLVHIRDFMMCTSYGARALLTLGMSALDRGHYLEALQYFEAVWDGFPETRREDPRLPFALELCRRMLGQTAMTGLDYGLAGYWSFDEGKGSRVTDDSGRKSHAHISQPRGENTSAPAWAPGKVKGGIDFANAGLHIPATPALQIGVGGSDFSVAFWVKVGALWHPNHIFAMRRGNENLHLQVGWKKELRFTIATRAPTWEEGQCKTPIEGGKWYHIGLVKAGGEVRVFVNGKLDTTQALKSPPALPNRGGITLGGGMRGSLDEVRLYHRALLDREVAALAGAVTDIVPTVSGAKGSAPLTVEMTAPIPTNSKAQCLWEFGDGERARGRVVEHTYQRGGNFEAVLSVTDTNGAVAVGRATVNVVWPEQHRALAKQMESILRTATPTTQPFPIQASSAPHASADDYTRFPPTADPLGLVAPVWQRPLWARPGEAFVFTQPVVTDDSVIYRQANIIYCRSLLNGELRWQNDTGGRVRGVNPGGGQYPMEDVLVQDGMVYTSMRKVGPTLVALDELTGQMKWAYGPMLAANEDEARMRFETAPAGGPMTVFAGYIFDDIKGDTHIDTEYGLMAFDSTTGRVKWRRPLCRLQPGLFTAGFARKYRNRIRSFMSPPIYHEGTLYYCTNAGAMAAVDALSGEVRWLVKYPYTWGNEHHIHDATRGFWRQGAVYARGGGLAYPQGQPMFWFNQRPLLIGDALYVVPVDASDLYRLDRATGKVVWRATKGQGVDARRTDGGAAWFMGPIESGELAIVYSFRNIGKGWQGPAEKGGVHLIDPDTGKTVWESGDMIEPFENPTVKWHVSLSLGEKYGAGLDGNTHVTSARPFLTEDNKLYVPTYAYQGWPYHDWFTHLAVLDLNQRKRIDWRRYLTPHLLDVGAWAIQGSEAPIKKLESIPEAHRPKEVNSQLKMLKAMTASAPPENRYPAEMRPFSRVTVDRFGTRFELRTGPASIGMVYDVNEVKKALASRTAHPALLAKAELAFAEHKLEASVKLLQTCLDRMPADDVAARLMVNQLSYRVHKLLAQGAARSHQTEVELKHCFGMSRSVGTLADEIETWFAFADAHIRAGDYAKAANQLQTVIRRYADLEYPISTLTLESPEKVMELSRRVLGGAAEFAEPGVFGKEMAHITRLLARGLDYYLGELTPVEKDCTLRADDLAISRLLKLARSRESVSDALDKAAEAALAQPNKTDAALIAEICQYPGTGAAQEALNRLLEKTHRQLQQADLPIEQRSMLRRRQWQLADQARIAALTLPKQWSADLTAPTGTPVEPAIGDALQERKTDMEEARGTQWLVLERRGRRDLEPDLFFVAGRVKTRVDHKFALYAKTSGDGKIRWKASEERAGQRFDLIRLRDKGDEPGFFEAFVYKDIVIVHGRYDVLAFNLADGRLKWRYEVPFAFEIEYAELNGDLLLLASESATTMLDVKTSDPRGEVVWDRQEAGDLYLHPYFCGDRLVSVRKMPFNMTVRYRSTGKLIGRLALPDLTLCESHPLLKDGPAEFPSARDGSRLLLTDGWYYLMLDVAVPRVVWKRRIDENDASAPPAMRFEMQGDYLAVVKKDYDVNTIYMLSSATGDILWRTDPKNAKSPQPLHAMHIVGDRLYGIRPHAGQGYYFTALDCKTGGTIFANEQTDYTSKPEIEILPRLYGATMVVRGKDRLDFELKAFQLKDGKLLHKMRVKAAGEFDLHGRASATAQNGRLLLLGKNSLLTAH